MPHHEIHYPAPPGPISLDQITEADRAALQTHVRKAKLVVEIGTFLGGSAEIMLEAMPDDGELITIDTFEGLKGTATGSIPSGMMLQYAQSRLERFGERATIIKGRSTDAAIRFPEKIVDFVFIDGAHDYENVLADIRAWLPAVKPDGIIGGHDFDQRAGMVLTMDDIVERSHMDFDYESGVHCGVVRAVSESFNQIVVENDPNSSIWTARPEWAR